MMPRLIFCFFLLIAGYGCGDNSSKKPLDNTTSGEINIVADETLMPLVDAEEYAFEGIYNKATIHADYLPEAEAINYMLNDSGRLVVAARELTEQEKAVFKEMKIIPRVTKIAEDAIALIVNKANKDTMINLVQLKKIVRGELNSWKELDSKSSVASIKFVFDNKNSSTVRYMQELAGVKELSKEKVYALKSNEEVISYVKENRDAIGVIGVNWVSDRDDSATQQFLKEVTIMNVAEIAGATEDEYYKPYQVYIAQKKYPLCRSVYMISREARAGLGTGFTAFVAGDKGQRIVLKMGLLPATAPVRIVEVTTEGPFDELLKQK